VLVRYSVYASQTLKYAHTTGSRSVPQRTRRSRTSTPTTSTRVNINNGQRPRCVHRADQPCGRLAGALAGPGAQLPQHTPPPWLTGRSAFKIWNGLQRKVRKAQDFVPVITATDVVEDKGDEVVRVAHFKEFHGQPPHEVREVCRSYYPTKVCSMPIM